jgi:hypothetical protein
VKRGRRGLRDIDIAKFERWIEALDFLAERVRPATAAARRQAEKELTEAWKKPRRGSAPALLLRTYDIPIETIATVLRRDCSDEHAGPGRGEHTRWTRAHYLVAWYIEALPRRQRTNGAITRMIAFVNKGLSVRGKPTLDPEVGSCDHNRVKELLRGPKRRRL